MNHTLVGTPHQGCNGPTNEMTLYEDEDEGMIARA